MEVNRPSGSVEALRLVEMDGPRPVFEVISTADMPGMGISQQPDGTLLCAMGNPMWAAPVVYMPVRPAALSSPTNPENVSAHPVEVVNEASPLGNGAEA